jgi:hypothetical protein
MKFSRIREILDARWVGRPPDLDRECSYGGAADLMSDALAFVASADCVLLTGLINEQSVRTAEMLDLHVLVFVRGKSPAPPVVKLADEKGIALLSTGYSMYEACGRLYAAGLPGFAIRRDRDPAAGEA